ncbi:hypothetical protein GPECTOR_13g794 [Gonium pectorale]|uniref:Uncharacterized protein n=1 Tax=Gonium pectorale TaxID=33097 RepID=A0A150GNB5_GONPE|nr:hypothetical protein GPECTOR_13g794 [Gonium pectorale]|eukprot:KXZ51307.1 hypothetical protein GPECTOR_13g794 [Gonium pectorale]
MATHKPAPAGVRIGGTARRDSLQRLPQRTLHHFQADAAAVTMAATVANGGRGSSTMAAGAAGWSPIHIQVMQADAGTTVAASGADPAASAASLRSVGSCGVTATDGAPAAECDQQVHTAWQPYLEADQDLVSVRVVQGWYVGRAGRSSRCQGAEVQHRFGAVAAPGSHGP